MTRVLTHLGFGTMIASKDPAVKVELDHPFFGRRGQIFQEKEVFLFSRWALLRVLNISGAGLFSTMQFYPSPEAAWVALGGSTPPDETKIFIDLESLRIGFNRRLLAEDYLLVNTWIDRWAKEMGAPFEEEGEAVSFFEEEQKCLAGAMGIGASALLDIRKHKLLRLYLAVAPPPGIIYRIPAEAGKQSCSLA